MRLIVYFFLGSHHQTFSMSLVLDAAQDAAAKQVSSKEILKRLDDCEALVKAEARGLDPERHREPRCAADRRGRPH